MGFFLRREKIQDLTSKCKISKMIICNYIANIKLYRIFASCKIKFNKNVNRV